MPFFNQFSHISCVRVSYYTPELINLARQLDFSDINSEISLSHIINLQKKKSIFSRYSITNRLRIGCQNCLKRPEANHYTGEG